VVASVPIRWIAGTPVPRSLFIGDYRVGTGNRRYETVQSRLGHTRQALSRKLGTEAQSSPNCTFEVGATVGEQDSNLWPQPCEGRARHKRVKARNSVSRTSVCPAAPRCPRPFVKH